VRWAVPQLHDIDALQMMVDPSLSGQYMTKSLSFYADIISRCVWVSDSGCASLFHVVYLMIVLQ